MIRSACTAFVVFGLLFLTPTTALAQLGGEYGPALRGAVIGGAAPYGINDGTGWVFGTVTDDDGDGVIELPLVPIPGRLAVGVTHDGGVHGSDIWDFMSNGVQQTSVPLFINAQTGAKVGINFGELMIPPQFRSRPASSLPSPMDSCLSGRGYAWSTSRMCQTSKHLYKSWIPCPASRAKWS
jgi:hypothetical protein